MGRHASIKLHRRSAFWCEVGDSGSHKPVRIQALESLSPNPWVVLRFRASLYQRERLVKIEGIPISNLRPMAACDDFDVLVIGGGHAGVEAALAAARMGARTALLTSNLDTIALMSCNPAIGGVGKGQLVREIDALGGAMGQAIDATGIQFRMLNRSKGPAMHGPRAQADKLAYQQEIRRTLDCAAGAVVREETVEDLLVEEGGVVGRYERSANGRYGFGSQATLRKSPASARQAARSIAPGGRALCRHVHARAAAPRRTRARRPHRRADHRGHQRGASAAGIRVAPVQDRHAAADRRPHDRLCPDRASAGRRRARAVLVSHRSDRHPAGPLLDHVHHAGGPRRDPREPAPRTDVQRADSIDRPALLPLGRNQDRPLRRQDAASALSRTGRPRDRRGLHQRALDQPAAGRAGRHAAADSPAWSGP